MKKWLLISIGILCSESAFADNVIFSCFTQSGKHLSVTQEGKQFQYSFGKPGKPELVFKNSYQKIYDNEDSYITGGTGFTTYQIALKNGAYNYAVFAEEGRKEADGYVQAGVEIKKNGKPLATVLCNPKREILYQSIYDVGLRFL